MIGETRHGYRGWSRGIGHPRVTRHGHTVISVWHSVGGHIGRRGRDRAMGSQGTIRVWHVGPDS